MNKKIKSTIVGGLLLLTSLFAFPAIGINSNRMGLRESTITTQTNELDQYLTPKIQHGPYKQNVNGNKITIVWTTDENNTGQNKVEYGQYSGIYTHSVSATTVDTFDYWNPKNQYGNYRHEAVIDSPWETGYYRVNSSGTLSNEHIYKVPGNGQYDDEFKFVVLADTRNGGVSGTAWDVINDMEARESDIDLFFHVGDVCGYPYDNEWAEAVDYFIDIDHDLDAVTYMALGCHEYMSSGTTKVFGYRDFFTFPPNGCGVENGTIVEEQWYSFDYKNVHFMILNTIGARWPAWENVLPDFRIGSKQHNWLISDLKKASVDPNIDFIFTFHHHPPYRVKTSGSGTRHYWRALIDNLCGTYDKYGVDVAFVGHDHHYHRTIRIYNNASAEAQPEDNGTTYITSGGGGAPLDSTGEAGWFTAYKTKQFHYLRCNVINGSLIVEMVRHSYGSTMDTFRLNKKLVADSNGPYYGLINVELEFNGIACGGKPPYTYHWDFGDTYTSDEQNPTHNYTSPGNYTVIFSVTDNESNTSSDTTYAWIQTTNTQPDKPTIDGPTNGRVGTSYDYTFSATDPDNSIIYLYVEWGDGTNSGWLGPYNSGEIITKSHKWSKQGTYEIKAQVKDPYEAESEWGTLVVTMPKNKPFFSNFNLLSWLFERFPLLEQILMSRPLFNRLLNLL